MKREEIIHFLSDQLELPQLEKSLRIDLREAIIVLGGLSMARQQAVDRMATTIRNAARPAEELFLTKKTLSRAINALAAVQTEPATAGVPIGSKVRIKLPKGWRAKKRKSGRAS